MFNGEFLAGKPCTIGVKDVVCDYGVFANGKLIPGMILNSKMNANQMADALRVIQEKGVLMAKIMEADNNHERYVEGGGDKC